MKRQTLSDTLAVLGVATLLWPGGQPLSSRR